MFAKFAAILFVALSVFTTAVAATPVPSETGTDFATRGHGGGFHSFNNYGGFSSMSNFDNFYGSSNFDNVQFSKKSITIVKEKELVCHSQSIQIIQQRLLILQEMAKRIITEQVCEVETQTIVFEQFHASLHGFSRDLRRSSGRQVGYDSGILSHYGSIIGGDGSLSTNDFGFSGNDLGHSYVVPSGNNWGSRSSSSVGSAYRAARSTVTSF
jgi:hypothetical protein